MAVVMDVTGDKEVDRAFAALPGVLQGKIERKALRAAARPILDDAISRVTHLAERLTRTLKLRAMKRRRRSPIVGIKVMTAITEYTDEGTVFNPHWIEFGIPNHHWWGRPGPPLEERPFLRPAMDAQRKTVLAVFRSTVKQLVEEAAREVRKN